MYADAATWNLTTTAKAASRYTSLAAALALVVILNLFDMVATITWIELGLAEEANPLMDVLLQIHPTLFAVVKLTLVSVAVSILWKYRSHRASHVAAGLSVALYLATYAVHAYGAVTLY